MSVPGNSSARVDSAPSIECFPLFLMSSSLLKHILPPVLGGTFSLALSALDRPLLFGILLRGHICSLIAPACQDFGRTFGCPGAP